MDLQDGDILSEKEAELFEAYEELHDVASDLVESGKVKNRQLISVLLKCAELYNLITLEHENDEGY